MSAFGKSVFTGIGNAVKYCGTGCVDSVPVSYTHLFDDLYRKLKKENFLADITDKEEMSGRLAYYLGEINICLLYTSRCV